MPSSAAWELYWNAFILLPSLDGLNVTWYPESKSRYILPACGGHLENVAAPCGWGHSESGGLGRNGPWAGRARLQEMGRGGGGEQRRQGGRLGEPEPWKATRDLSANAMGGGLVLCSLEGHPKLLLPWRAENGNRVSRESLF